MKVWMFILMGLTLSSLACSDFFTPSSKNRTMILEGTVTDAATDAPLEGVFVSLEWMVPDTTSNSATDRIDTSTSATGEYRIETKLGNISCHPIFLFFATAGYEAVRRVPDCKGGKQVFNVKLEPDP